MTAVIIITRDREIKNVTAVIFSFLWKNPPNNAMA